MRGFKHYASSDTSMEIFISVLGEIPRGVGNAYPGGQKMKKMWKIRKDSEGVSPVIATILMVAITVVLAAVLYVMVMGFGGGGTQTPTGSFTNVEKDGDSYRAYFGSFSPDTDYDEVTLNIQDDDNSDTSDTLNEYTDNGDGDDVELGDVTFTIDVTDLAENDRISNGDYITISSDGTEEPTGEYTIRLIFEDTGDVIDSESFTA
ncbi:MAG: archaellin/type IV pilin N-terminal domain-containing protein [Methanomassiliicoccales archaeon]